MRNPNGYGSIYKMKGKRRKPYRVVKGIKGENGKIKRTTIGYTGTKKEALDLLAKYNNSPYDLNKNKITLIEVYEQWSKEHFNKISEITKINYISNFKKLEPLYNKNFKDITLMELQDLFNNLDISSSSKGILRGVLKLLYMYSIKYEILTKDLSQFIEIGKKEKVVERKPFTAEEIQILWDNSNQTIIKTILILIYTGLRITEFLNIKIKDIDFDNRILRAGIKTKSGKNRIIPLNYKIIPLIKDLYRDYNTYLLTNKKNKKFIYATYGIYFRKILKDLKIKHKIHDTRHTFATLLNNAEANKTSIKNIMGHSDYKTTEMIYTHKNIEELKKAVDLL